MSQPAETPPAAAPSPAPRAGRAKPVFIGLVLVVVVGAGALFITGRGRETTDDAFVEGRVVAVASRVQGQVKAVRVVDNQEVNAGDVLVELDTAELDARKAASEADLLSAQAQLSTAQAQLAITERNAQANLTQAEGGLGQASSGVDASRAQLEQARADLAAAESRLVLAQSEIDRGRSLLSSGTITKAEFDARQNGYDTAVAAKQQAQARLVSTQASISSSEGGVTLAKGRFLAAQTGPQQVIAAKAAVALADARLKQAGAALTLAELNLSYATIKAPVKGVVSRRNVEVGQNVSPERPLMALVPLDDVWVVANFKEDQLREMSAGKKAIIRVDAFPDVKINAHVDSLSAGTGSRFELLPPDNASGNFVKVVQRVPVLLRLDEKPAVIIRPGMSVSATVVTSSSAKD